MVLCISSVFSQTKHVAFDTKQINNNCKPCDDFYEYAIGGWRASNAIPADQGRWGQFNVLERKNTERLRSLLDGLTKPSTKLTPEQKKLGDYYMSAMDTAHADALGTTPLMPFFKKIDAIKTQEELQNVIAEFHTYTTAIAFNFGSSQDMKDSKRVIGEINQGGLTLPDKDYYLAKDSRSEDIRKEYLKHLKAMCGLAGMDAKSSETMANQIMTLETALATASLSRVELRDPNKQYNMFKKAELNKLGTNFNWNKYFSNIKSPELTELNIGMPGFIRAFDSLLTALPLDTWKAYVKWRILDETSPLLTQALRKENFHFEKEILTGQTADSPQWKKTIEMIDHTMGDALAKLYVEKYFTAESKKRALEMIANISTALREDIKVLGWMSDSTKQMALNKLSTFETKIGYAETWRDYSAATISKTALVDNWMSLLSVEYRRRINKIGQPLDRKEWHMTAPTINAYYSPTMNEIVFPAGILQAPFFDPEADDAINYGGMGAVIGHEISHGFDDQGAQFDKDGNLKNWWTEHDLKNFNERSECIIKQFNAFKVQDSLNVNGELVVGESIADLGGLTLAYLAYQKTLKGKPAKPIDGFTGEQRFFFGWAQVWAMNMRPEMERLRLKTDPHPLSKFRVNGTVSNMDAFKKAFNCKEGDKMVRPQSERCEIW